MGSHKHLIGAEAGCVTAAGYRRDLDLSFPNIPPGDWSRTHDELFKLDFQLAQPSVAKSMVQPPVPAAANSFRVARPR